MISRVSEYLASESKESHSDRHRRFAVVSDGERPPLVTKWCTSAHLRNALDVTRVISVRDGLSREPGVEIG